ncbi:hypothetical protein V5799_022541 [Amblyomma americanum]|uniref:Uncharacterized protein n=1 Tax=Amblyomma americanum TaxID=6943 RepID=A0AAQ4FK77_AMBAM
MNEWLSVVRGWERRRCEAMVGGGGRRRLIHREKRKKAFYRRLQLIPWLAKEAVYTTHHAFCSTTPSHSSKIS